MLCKMRMRKVGGNFELNCFRPFIKISFLSLGFIKDVVSRYLSFVDSKILKSFVILN